MRYAEYTPAPDLRHWVDRYWLIEDASPSAQPQRILPDGHPEWVVHLGDPFAGQGSCLAIGQMTRAISLQAVGKVRAFGITFRPEGAYAFTGFDQSELTDHIADAAAPQWRERVGNGEPVAATEEMLRGRLRLAPDTRVACAVDLLADGWSVDEAADRCNWSPRQLERVIVTRTGLPPKLLGRLSRFQRALRLRKQGLAWAAVACDAGYADQSHLVREFRQFAGDPPSSLEQSALTEVFVR